MNTLLTIEIAYVRADRWPVPCFIAQSGGLEVVRYFPVVVPEPYADGAAPQPQPGLGSFTPWMAHGRVYGAVSVYDPDWLFEASVMDDCANNYGDGV